jgi:alpha-galactosidase
LTAQILGKPARPGRIVRRLAGARLEASVEPAAQGLVVRGTVTGRPGRVEVFRLPAPAELLLNNWQSWGPMEAATPATRFPELEAVVRDYSPWLFSPLGAEILRGPTSDHVTAWDGGLAGFLASRMGHPFFTVEGDDLVGWIDYFDAVFEDPVALEPLAVLEGGRVEDLLAEYGRLVKRRNRVRVNDWNPVGWCSWYHYFGKLGWPEVVENLEAAAADRRSFPFEVFQVDDGYETEIGDWLTTKPGYPGLDGLAAAIKGRGFRAGIWAAPFSAAESSRLFAEHPDWMVAGDDGRPKPCYKGWGRTIYALDTTHPEAAAWLDETVRTLRAAGFSYLKFDFLFAGAMPGTRRKKATPIQAYREGMQVVRRAAGTDFVLGCGAPLLPSVGLVDGMRIGEDTAPYWKTKPSGFQGPNAYFALKNALMRQFMHRSLWLNDPDCLLVRDKEIELTGNERELYALTAGALDNMIIDSDRLKLLGQPAKDLLRQALGLRGRRAVVRGLLGEFGRDLFVVDGREGGRGGFRLATNLSESPKSVENRVVPPRSALFLDPRGRD